MIRATTEVGPSLPEQLVFSTDEAELSVRAISYYVTSSLRTLEANWDAEGWHGIANSPEQAVEEIGRVSGFVNFHQRLAEKFSGVVDKPEQATELSPQEIETLGFSLFRLGNSGLTHARRAINSGWVGPRDTASRARTETAIQQTADSAYGLFKELEPIGKSKADIIGWMIWKNKPSDV